MTRAVPEALSRAIGMRTLLLEVCQLLLLPSPQPYGTELVLELEIGRKLDEISFLNAHSHLGRL